jgi:Zn-dependent protease
MINKNEATSFVVVAIILGFTISLMESLEIFFYATGSILTILILTTLTKKFVSSYYDSEIEIKIWEIKRYGFKAHKKLKKAFPAGAFFPIILIAFTGGILNWFACLTFEIKAKVSRAAKRHGIYSFSEITERHTGLIAASGIFLNIILAFLGYLFNFPEFSRLNIYYAFFNMIPISDLDGNKILFGSITLWYILEAMVLLGILSIFFIV